MTAGAPSRTLLARTTIGLALVLMVSPAIAQQSQTARQIASSTLGMSGVWWIKNEARRWLPLNGGAVPLTAEGTAAYRTNIERMRASNGKEQAPCLPDGVPRQSSSPYPFQIVQAPGFVIFVYEAHNYRVLPLGGAHPPPDQALPFFNGHGVAHWEGETLVVDTINLTEKTFLDATGLPHSDQLHVTERFKLAAGGRELESIVTIEDPVTFKRSWRVRFVYEKRPDIALEEYVCGEAHRDLSDRTPPSP